MYLLPQSFLAAALVPASSFAQAAPAPAADAMTRLVTDHADKPGVQEILFAILFSFALNLLVAWTYKQTYRGTRYSQDYVHTLLILGTVVTLVILVVVGNLAAAFGMFAAFSIIRFRRNVGQSRDIIQCQRITCDEIKNFRVGPQWWLPRIETWHLSTSVKTKSNQHIVRFNRNQCPIANEHVGPLRCLC